MDHVLAKNVSQTKISLMDHLSRTVYHTNHTKSFKSTYGIKLVSGPDSPGPKYNMRRPPFAYSWGKDVDFPIFAMQK